jgi:hypothetical protein
VADQREKPVQEDWGDRLNIAYNRTWEWRDAMGCLWLPGLFVILSVAIWLGSLGAPALLLQVGTIAADDRPAYRLLAYLLVPPEALVVLTREVVFNVSLSREGCSRAIG